MCEDGVLRVLAIDDDSVSLSVLARNLQQCGYKVTTSTKPTEALALLRANRDDFDVVITDLMMPDMDGFQLLETIHSEIDVPVIMVSTESNPKMIVKGVKSGAQDYFVKPVQVEDLKKLPEYVVMKRLESSERSLQEGELSEKCEIESDHSDTPKRKYKKFCKRVNWTPELHDKFMNAVDQIEAEECSKVIPTKILEIMNEPSLTRENVASHLQKFRKGITKKRSSKLNESNRVAGASLSASTSDNSRPTTSTNIGQYTNFSSSRMMNSATQNFPKTESLYPTNQNPLLFPPSSAIPLTYYPQMHPQNISTPMLRNASTPMLESVLNATTRAPPEKCSRFSNTCQMPYGPEFAPYTQSPALMSSYQMQHRGVPTQMIVNPQAVSQLQQALTTPSGEHDMQNASQYLISQNGQMNNLCCKEHTEEYPSRLEHQNSLDCYLDNIIEQFLEYPVPDCSEENETQLLY